MDSDGVGFVILLSFIIGVVGTTVMLDVHYERRFIELGVAHYDTVSGQFVVHELNHDKEETREET